MSTTPMSMKCRTCMKDCKRLHHLDDYVDNKFRVMEMLDATVPQINIKAASQLSKFVCGLCLDKLLASYKFQLMCIETHIALTGMTGAEAVELDVKQEVDWDPLKEEDYVEMKDTISYEYGKNEEEVIDIVKRGDKDVSDTDSSNEKLNILRERKLRKIAQATASVKISGLSCQLCGNIFKHLSRLKLHDCTQKSPISCNRCGHNCKTESFLRKHMKTHEKVADNNNASKHLLNPCASPNIRRKCATKQKRGRLKKKTNTTTDVKYQAIENTDKMEVINVLIKNEIVTSETIEETHMDGFVSNEDWFNHETDIEEAENETTKKKKSVKKPKHGKNTDFVDTGVGEVEKPNTSNRRNGHFPCQVCGKIFDRPYRLKRHSSVHSLDKPYACEICKCRFTSTSYLKAHKLLHDIRNKDEESSAEGYKCPDCPRRFEKQASLSAHRQIHTRDAFNANYNCSICQREFTNVKSLTDHITNEHPEAQKHQCELCEKAFVLHAHLVEHLNRHKGNKNLVCVICEKEFGFMNTLKEHMRSHNGESPYLCPQCGKTFRNASNLRQHMERHSGLKKYQCSECPSRFNCRSDLKKHIDTHTSTKSHECDICGSCFTRSYSLQKHKRLHTGKRPFKCDQCNMTFSSLYHLKRHIRTHTGEKPYKCKYCERAYAESGDLNKHLRTHVGENTYICDQCPMAFKYQSELRQHISEHYKIEQKLKEAAVVEMPEGKRLEEMHITNNISCNTANDLN